MEEKEKQAEVNAEVQSADMSEKGGEKEADLYTDDYTPRFWVQIVLLLVMVVWEICMPKEICGSRLISDCVAMFPIFISGFYIVGGFSKHVRLRRKLAFIPGMLILFIGANYFISGKHAHPCDVESMYTGIKLMLLGAVATIYAHVTTREENFKNGKK